MVNVNVWEEQRVNEFMALRVCCLFRGVLFFTVQWLFTALRTSHIVDRQLKLQNL